MRAMQPLHIHLLAIASFMAAACSGNVQIIKPAIGSRDAEKAIVNGNSLGTSTDPMQGQTAFMEAVFNVNATTLGGMQVCQGDTQFKVNIAFSPGTKTLKLFDIPKGEVDCSLIGKINLAEILGGFAGMQPPEVKDPVVVRDNLIAVKVIGLGVYEPARPMLPAFLTTPRAELAQLNKTTSITIDDTYEKKKSSGSVTVRTLSMGGAYKPEAMMRTFNDVLEFEVINTGFDEVNKIRNTIFDRMAFKISLDPAAILHLEFDGNISDFLDAQTAAKNQTQGAPPSSSGMTNMLGDFGKVFLGFFTKMIKIHLVMDLKSMRGLEDAPASKVLIETIGGQPVK